MEPVELAAFNFAKEVATQLITLSTGLLALSVTFTKDILKGVPKGGERRLRIAWGIHLVSIVCGVWSLMALTGTLMPVDPATRVQPLQFGSNVRVPAIGQVILFVLGTVLLILVYGRRSLAAGNDEEYQAVVIGSSDELSTKLNTLRADRWEVVGFSAQESSKFVALLKRSKVV